jgi:hypothetical protein
MDEVKVGNGVSKVDKRTREYRDSIKAFEDGVNIGKEVDPDRCCDPHGLGCRGLVKSPAIGVSQPCEACVWRNA